MTSIIVSANSADRLQTMVNERLSRCGNKELISMQYSSAYNEKLKEIVFSVCIILK